MRAVGRNILRAAVWRILRDVDGRWEVQLVEDGVQFDKQNIALGTVRMGCLEVDARCQDPLQWCFWLAGGLRQTDDPMGTT